MVITVNFPTFIVYLFYLPSFGDSMLLMVRNLKFERCENFLFAELVSLTVKEKDDVDLCGYLKGKIMGIFSKILKIEDVFN